MASKPLDFDLDVDDEDFDNVDFEPEDTLNDIGDLLEEEDEEDVLLDDEDEDSLEKGSNKKTIIIVIAIALVVAIVGIIIIVTPKNKNKGKITEVVSPIEVITPLDKVQQTSIGENISSTPITNSVESDNTIVTEVKEEIIPGMTDFNNNQNNTVYPKVYSSTDYIKDLNGNDIPAVYEVDSTTYEDIFVNYEKRRAILDDGMEMFWLEIEYEDRNYRCQIPFYIYKALKEKGICIVQAEVLHLEDGSIIISYMVVNNNYLDLLK